MKRLGVKRRREVRCSTDYVGADTNANIKFSSVLDLDLPIFLCESTLSTASVFHATKHMEYLGFASHAPIGKCRQCIKAYTVHVRHSRTAQMALMCRELTLCNNQAQRRDGCFTRDQLSAAPFPSSLIAANLRPKQCFFLNIS